MIDSRPFAVLDYNNTNNKNDVLEIHLKLDMEHKQYYYFDI